MAYTAGDLGPDSDGGYWVIGPDGDPVDVIEEWAAGLSHQAALDLAARKVITNLPPRMWAGWACFFLEALEAHARQKGADPAPTLEAIRRDLAGRLEAGRW